MSRNISLRENQLRDLAPCATMGIFGKRRTGKSTLAALLVKVLSELGIGRFVVFSGNKDNQQEWARVVHPMYIHGKDLDQLEKIKAYQDDRVGRVREKFETEEHERSMRMGADYVPREFEVPVHLRLCVFIDDTGNDRKFMHCKMIKDLCSNGRHYGMDVVFILQYLNQLAPENRDQLDYAFLMQTTNSKSIDKVFNEYVTKTCCPSHIFNYLLAASTSRKGKCMLIDNARGSMMLQERLFFVKIPFPITRGPFGHKNYVKYAKTHYLSKRRQERVRNREVDIPTSAPSTRRTTTSADMLTEMTNSINQEEDEDRERDSYETEETGGESRRRYMDSRQLEMDDRGNEGGGSSVFTYPNKSSVVSLNRREDLRLSALRAGKHSFVDHRGNQVRVQLHNATSKSKIE